ncbi:unnamed protein product [Brassicogethes aeneus]|uniref:Chaoptin n=1 Tax=Brassicogethes aeneus TaxID=1431903 RepID=A0A9P0BCE3_BRAAE|nr:unnamed protein product [Brassicogethes aeneus]
MEILNLLRFGYAMVICTFLLMVWLSLSSALSVRETGVVRYPPCYFNPLCSCSKAVPDLGIVHCHNVQLPRIPVTVNISKVFMLHLENNGLRTIEPFFLQSTGLYKIIITKNPLTVVPDEAFLGLERSLWELELSYNKLTSIPNRALRYLQKLRLLDLTGNEINTISPENWRGLENSLEELILADNSITHLPIDSFSGLPMVDTINLKGNNLREIDPSVFRDGMGRLAHLILADNQLSSVPYQALQPLRTLKTLDLSYNRVNKMEPVTDTGATVVLNFQINLDVFRLDYNQLTILQPASFEYFSVLNKTYLDGNPLSSIEENAFRKAKIKELYIRFCGLTTINPASFGGLENSLEILDLSGNNIALLPENLLHRFEFLRTLSLRDNIISKLNPIDAFNAFLFTLYKLDLRGTSNVEIKIQDLRRLRSLRVLYLSKLGEGNLDPQDFQEFGMDLEELYINSANIHTIKHNAFKYVHGLKLLDFSENSISTIEEHAFKEIGHSLVTLRLTRGLSSSYKNIPAEAFKVLVNLENLDLSNNRIKTMQDTAFHFLKKLKTLELQDNIIEIGDIHQNLEEIYLSFNNIKVLQQHTFVDLARLEQLHLDDNSIETLDRRSFMNLERLKRLNLKGNKIASITYEAFQNLPELEDLDISYNKLTNFEFAMFDQVGTLAVFHVNVSHNNLRDLTVNIGSTFEANSGLGTVHSNIRVLDLSFNNISMISKQFFRPIEISITHLYMGHNKLLNATREVFGNMPHLQWLDLSSNELYEMDFDMFRNTKKLQVLFAAYNRIADIPNDLFRFLNNLRIVDFSNNRLRNLPDNLFREEGLERFDISHNMLSKLPLTSFSIATAISLREMDLSWNSISSLSHGGVFERFKNLNWLDLSYNRLAQIDAGTFKGLPKLSSLDLSHNAQLALEGNGLSLQGLEYSLLHLYLDNVSLSHIPVLPTPHLVTLSLAFNSLPTVPPEMATNMTSLQNLNLNYNDLTAVPIVTHSLNQLRTLSMVANPITFLSNTSLLGVAGHLINLDIRNFDLTILESGAFCKMYSLRTLKINLYSNIKNFNIPSYLQFNSGLRNLEIHVPMATDNNLDKELNGEWPTKLRNITFSGRGLKNLGQHILQGIKSPNLHFALVNSSISKIQSAIFQNAARAKNITLELRDNYELKSFLNPSTGMKPNLYKKTFLIDMDLSNNKWSCDCDLGWIEVWLRKKRQYLCGESPSSTPYFTHKDYICRHADEDLRISNCNNKNNNSIMEVLKTDIECGWSSAIRPKYFSIGLILFLVLHVIFK